MRFRAVLGIVCGVAATVSPKRAAWSQEGRKAPPVIASAEAHRHVGQECTVEMTVRASKNSAHRKVYFLDSEEDFHDEKNVAILIRHELAPAFRERGIDDPSVYYRGKVIRVTGKLIHESDQVRIRVSDPAQIEVMKERDERPAESG
jgi:hypothetical protein